MKSLRFFLIAGILLLIIPMHAQKRQVKPYWPDWLQELPKAENPTYEYYIIQGMGPTKEAALAAANENIHKSYIDRLGNGVTYGKNGIQRHEDVYEVPFNVVCNPYYERQDSGWVVYLLCQIANDGMHTPRFDAFYECNSYKKYEAFSQKHNVTSLIASTFIPGMGQMLKKQGGVGAAFLIGEIAIFGGGTACHFLGEEQVKIMKATGTTYADYQKAKNTKNTLDIAMWTCFGVGAAVHIANMVHAWFVPDKHAPANIAFTPALIPTNEYSTPNYAMGAGVQITF